MSDTKIEGNGCAVLVCAIGIILLVAWGVQALWNAIVVPKFGDPSFGYWETFGALLLIRLVCPSKSGSKS